MKTLYILLQAETSVTVSCKITFKITVKSLWIQTWPDKTRAPSPAGETTVSSLPAMAGISPTDCENQHPMYEVYTDF